MAEQDADLADLVFDGTFSGRTSLTPGSCITGLIREGRWLELRIYPALSPNGAWELG